MASIWNALSKLGLAEEVKEEAQPSPAKPVPKPRTESMQSVDSTLVEKIDEDSRSKLIKSLEAQKFPAIEELNNILGPLKGVIPDENLRYQTALNILGSKFNTEQLLGDYDKGFGILDETQRQFRTALDEQLEKRVGSKIRNVQKFDADIQNIQNEISSLTTKLTEVQAARETENSGVSKEQARLDLTRERFDLAHRDIRGNLERERQKVAKRGDIK